MHTLQNSHENNRPVGRFLLDVKDFEGKHDTYTYASRFAANYSDILNRNWSASRVSIEEINGQRVELEFITDAMSDAFAWRVAVGNEQYEIHTNGCETYGIYYAFTPQRAVLQRQDMNSAAELYVLQGIVEHMTDTVEFHRNASMLRSDKTRTHASIDKLAAKAVRTYGEDKNLGTLKSHLFLAGFPVGSRDSSDYVPLLGTLDSTD